MNETMSQLIDAVRAVQHDQSKFALIIDKLATKVLNCAAIISRIFISTIFVKKSMNFNFLNISVTRLYT